MAQSQEVVKLEVTVLDRNWLRKSVEAMRDGRLRAAKKEAPGSEIEALRRREVEQLTALLGRL